MVDNEKLHAITQSLIAIIVVLGGGLTLIFKPDVADKVIPVVTFVVGFYFSQAATKSGSSAMLNAVSAAQSTSSGGGTSGTGKQP